MNKPFVSIVIPTRNRAELLPFAIRSVLNQTFDDLEIIVSDNCSSDETPRIVQGFGEKRIKYFRSAQPLAIGDSWEFALSHSKGEFIGFLSDDDAYSKIFLETMCRILDESKAEIASARIAPYYSKHVSEYGRNIGPGSLALQPYDRELSVIGKNEAINSLFSRFGLTTNPESNSLICFPQLTNTIHHSSLIKRIKNKVGRLFPIVGSDFYTAALFLNAVEEFCFINEPLYLSNTWEGSSTAGDRSMFERYPDEKQLDFVPLKKLLTLANYGRNSVLRARSEWGPDFHDVPIDMSYYFISSFHEIKYMQANKIDMSAETAEFESVLAKQDSRLQRQVRSAISRYSPNRSRIKLAIKKTGLGNFALKLKNRGVRIQSGFSDIAQCGESIDDTLLKRFSDK